MTPALLERQLVGGSCTAVKGARGRQRNNSSPPCSGSDNGDFQAAEASQANPESQTAMPALKRHVRRVIRNYDLIAVILLAIGCIPLAAKFQLLGEPAVA